MATQKNLEKRMTSRDHAKERHRAVLVNAATEAIFKHGLAGVTVSRILDQAKLSRGMINLHFSSKQNLLLEVARALSDEYATNWQNAVDEAGNKPEDKLRAIIVADFDPEVLNERNMSVWFALRGDVGSTPEYMPYVDSRDVRLQEALLQVCSQLCEEGPYPNVNPKLVTHALTALLEGMWTDFYLHPKRFDRETGLEATLHVLATFFPKHF